MKTFIVTSTLSFPAQGYTSQEDLGRLQMDRVIAGSGEEAKARATKRLMPGYKITGVEEFTPPTFAGEGPY